MIADPTKRFSDRVDNYVKYRPTYPVDVIDFLKKECHLSDQSKIADVGSGTGIFTNLLLNGGFKVFAVEPNQAMQNAAIQWLGGNENLTSISGTAEATTLPAKSIDLVTCAQAFHWFNDEKTKLEFKRILKDVGRVALIWNNRQPDVDDFSMAYEHLLQENSIDYNKVNHRNIEDIDFKAFFKDGIYQLEKFPNSQVFDKGGMMGRVFSSSYVPKEDTPSGEKFRELLSDIFDKYNIEGKVGFYYQTEIYLGKV